MEASAVSCRFTVPTVQGRPNGPSVQCSAEVMLSGLARGASLAGRLHRLVRTNLVRNPIAAVPGNSSGQSELSLAADTFHAFPGCRSVTGAVRAQASATSAASFLENRESGVAHGSSLGELLRQDFPILHQEMADGMPLVYLDSAATSQKPRQVLQAMDQYYQKYNANVHRGVHTLSALATDAYEGARDRVRQFINASSREEVVFTRNASEAINLVAQTWGLTNLKPGDEIVLTVAEHHSNLVPWQMLTQRTGAVLRFAELRSVPGQHGGQEINVEQLLGLITPQTKLVAVHHVSNVLGEELPIKAIVEQAHSVGALVLLDACQSVPHMAVDVQSLEIDFAVASAHKMLAPTGIGFLYGRSDLLSSMPPFLGGGEMIQDVFLDHSTYSDPPARFEAGTPAIAEAVGLAAAIDYLQERVPGGMKALHDYERELTSYLYQNLVVLPGVTIYGPPPSQSHDVGGSSSGSASSGLFRTHRAAALCAFNVDGIHPTDLSTFLDQQHGIAIRSGHHCAQPLHRALGVGSSARVSLHCYNTKEEIDAFIAALKDTQDFFVGAQA